MPSEDEAAIKLAAKVCNDRDMKLEIMCTPESFYRRNLPYDPLCRRDLWKEILERKAIQLLENSAFSKKIRTKAVQIVPSIGLRMLIWGKFYENTFEICRTFWVEFLNESFFTPLGTIDAKKVAAALMKEKRLNTLQKFKLACFHCVVDRIPSLFKKLSECEKTDLQDNDEHIAILQFWTHYLTGDIEQMKGDMSLKEYRLQQAAESGSLLAVEFCIAKTGLKRKKDVIVDAALAVVESNKGTINDDWSAFIINNCDTESGWIPYEFYVDIVYVLVSKMSESQKVRLLIRDIESSKVRRFVGDNMWRSRVLEYFLNWPYQGTFMSTVELVWNTLPSRTHAELLLDICSRIEPDATTSLRYGEEKLYDYRKLLGEYWKRSPEKHKRYFLKDKVATTKDCEKLNYKEGKELIMSLLTTQNFTDEDREIIRLILDNASECERINLITSPEGATVCLGLMKEERWEILEEFLSSCFDHDGDSTDFKRDLASSPDAQIICLEFVASGKPDAADRFVEFSCLPEHTVEKFKREMIFSDLGKETCLGLLSPDKTVDNINAFVSWFLPSAFVRAIYKKNLIFSLKSVRKCLKLVLENEADFLEKYIAWCIPPREERETFKLYAINAVGVALFEELILKPFEGGEPKQWEMIELLLNWCFSSEEDVKEFKKKFFSLSGKIIILGLTNDHKWKEAEQFFSWISLPPCEIQAMKKAALFSEDCNVFRKALESKDNTELAKRILQWYLTDEETVREFRCHLKKKKHEEQESSDQDVSFLKIFDPVIEEYLCELEQRRVKRKPETTQTTAEESPKKVRGSGNSTE